MADVTSTARLIVTVEGEGKIKALAAQIKALQGMSGSKRIAGVGGPAQMQAQNFAMKRAATQMVAANTNTMRAVKQVAAGQKITGKMIAPMQAQVRQTAKLVAPMVAQQAVIARTVSKLAPAQAAIAKTQAAWIKSRQPGRGVPPGPSGITPGLIASILSRNPGMSAAQAKANIANPMSVPLPQSSAQKAAAAKAAAAQAKAAAKAQTAATAAAAKASTPSQRIAAGGRSGGGLAALGQAAITRAAAEAGLGAGVGTTLARGLGTAAIAAAPFAAAIATVATGFKAANAQAEDLVTNTGKAMKKRREVEDIEARQAAGETVFGKAFAQLEKGVPQLLSAQRAKRGIAGEKGIMGRLGLSQKNIAEAEKAGKKLDAYGIGEILAGKREELEKAVTGAPSPKAKAAAQKKLDQFWKDVALLPEGYTRAAAFGKAALQQNRENQAKIQQVYGAGLADEKTQLQQAQENVLLRGQLAGQFKESFDRMGSFAMPGVNQALAALNAKALEIGPGISELAGRLASLGGQLLKITVGKIDSSWVNDITSQINSALAGFNIEDETAGTIMAKLQTAFNGMMSKAIAGMTSGEGSAQLLEFVQKDMKVFWESVKENLKRLGLVDKEKTDAEKKADLEHAERERQRLIDREGEQPYFGPKPATFDERFGGVPPKVVPTVPAMTVNADTATVTSRMTPAPISTQPPGNVRVDTEGKPIGGRPPAMAQPAVAPSTDLQSAATNAATAFSSGVQSGVTTAGTSGGNAFSNAAKAGISEAGSAGGKAFAGAINPGAIGSAIGAAAASVISGATVNVNVPGAVTAPGSRGSPPGTGTDRASGVGRVHGPN